MNMTNRFNPRLKTVEISKIRNFDQQISSIPGIIKLTLGEPDFSCLLYTSPSPRDGLLSRMPSSA